MRRLVGALLLTTAALLAVAVPSLGASGDDAATGAYGYVWVDSVAGNGFFAFEEGGTPVTIQAYGLGTNVPLPAGFSFDLYDSTYSAGDLYVGEDGLVGFDPWTGRADTALANVPAPDYVPGGAEPNEWIAPFFAPQYYTCTSAVSGPGSTNPRLYNATTDGVYAFEPTTGADRWIISYQDWLMGYPSNGNCIDFMTYQAKLFSGTDIVEFHYRQVSNWINADQNCVDYVVGVEDGTVADRGLFAAQTTEACVGPRLDFEDDALRIFRNDNATSGKPNAVSDTWVVDQDISGAIRISNNDDPLVYSGLTGPTSGTVDALPAGTVYGSVVDLTYTPNQGYYGPDSFSYTVDDGYDPSLDAVKTIHVNAPPVGVADAISATQGDPMLSVDVLSDDSDAYYSTYATDPNAPELRITAVGATTLGTLAIDAAGTGLEFTPSMATYGSETVTYTISDGRISVPVALTIDVERLAFGPVVDVEGIVELVAGETVTVTDSHLLTTDATYDAAQLTYTLQTLPAFGSLVHAGTTLVQGDPFTQADIDAGLVSYTSSQAGTTTAAFTVANPEDIERDANLTFLVHPLGPPTARISVLAGPYFSELPIRLNDDSVRGSYPIASYAWTILDENGVQVGSFVGPVYDFSPAALGDYTARLEVTDTQGNSATTEVTLDVSIPYSRAEPYFIVSDATPEVGQEVVFTDTSEEGSYEIVTREWLFQDGHVPTVEPVVRHTFASAGAHRVTLRIVDLGGNEYFHHEWIVVGGDTTVQTPASDFLKGVASASGKPVADAGPDQVVLQGSVVELDGSRSSASGDAGKLSYQWTHADGVALPMAGADSARPRVSIPYLPQSETETILQLVVTDATGRVSAPDMVRLVIRDSGQPSLAPLAEPGAVFDFDASATGDVSFTATDPPGSGVRYLWDFGDGATEETTEPSVRHRFPAAGVYQVRLRVEDSFDRVAESQRAVVISDEPETAGVDGLPEPAARPPVHEDGNGWAVGLLLAMGVVVVAAVAGAVWLIQKRRRAA